MPTPHNEALKGEIASVVLMPGDPLRAKYIADSYLKNPVSFNTVRNMLGYTGTYKGKEISVMGSGMGIPSMGIYSYELYSYYDVDVIIRIGSAGGYSADLHTMDVVLATDAFSNSNYAYDYNQNKNRIMEPDVKLNDHIKKIAKKFGTSLKDVRLHSSDIFYAENDTAQKEAEEMGCKAVEMESFALFHNASVLNKKAACICTISNSFVYEEEISHVDRVKRLNEMILVALEAAVTL